MPSLAAWLKSGAEPASNADRRLANRFLKYWERLRGRRRFPLITDLNLEDIGDFVPYAFNIDLCFGVNDPIFRFVGRELARDCGDDMTNKRPSELSPQSLLARMVLQIGEVVADEKPIIVSDRFVDGQGSEILYRAIMLPFSRTGDEVDYIVGAINSKAVPCGAVEERSERGTGAGNVNAGKTKKQSSDQLVAPFQHPGQDVPSPGDRRAVSDLITDVEKAISDTELARPASHVSGAPRDPEYAEEAKPVQRGRVIVIGSEKGGTGKSTTAMHLILSLLYKGHKVGSIDLDSPQRTLSRYIENRRAFNESRKLNLPVPDHIEVSHRAFDTTCLETDFEKLLCTCDYLVIDTPGSDTALSRQAHAWADTLITTINDSFVDLDTLAVVDPDTQKVVKQGHYAQMVADARRQKIGLTGRTFDWIVVRNRLSNLDARNKQRVADALEVLSSHLDFRNGSGFSERVIYREMFLSGLTLLDLRDGTAGIPLSMSHVAARQELRGLVDEIDLPVAARAGHPQ